MSILLTGHGKISTKIYSLYTPYIATLPPRNRFDLSKTKYKKILKKRIQSSNIKVVIHAAGYSYDTNSKKAIMHYRCINDNIIATKNVVDVCTELNIPLIYISCNTLGFIDLNNMADLDTYTLSKLTMESLVLTLEKGFVLRLPSMELTPDPEILGVMKTIFSLAVFLINLEENILGNYDVVNYYLPFVRKYCLTTLGIADPKTINPTSLKDPNFVRLINSQIESYGLLEILQAWLNSNIHLKEIVDEAS